MSFTFSVKSSYRFRYRLCGKVTSFIRGSCLSFWHLELRKKFSKSLSSFFCGGECLLVGSLGNDTRVVARLCVCSSDNLLGSLLLVHLCCSTAATRRLTKLIFPPPLLSFASTMRHGPLCLELLSGERGKGD